jgi:VanZ family protein
VTPGKAHVALPLLLMAVLYWLSSLPGNPLPEDAAHNSLFQWMTPAVQNALHVPAYAALTLAWRWALGAWMRSPVSCALVACAIASVCGVLDEWHQSFVPGRFASATDVVLDIAGVALGISLAAWIGSRTGAFKPPVSAQKGGSDT